MASADGSIEFQTNDFADIFAVAAEDQRQAGLRVDSEASKFDVVHEESAFDPPTRDRGHDLGEQEVSWPGRYDQGVGVRRPEG